MRTVSKYEQILVNLFLLFSSLNLSSFGFWWTLETVLFDKVYYQKSIAHGYYPRDRYFEFSDFGARASDISIILELSSSNKPEKRVLGTSQTDDRLVIAVIGDSFVWGQGVRNEDRMSEVLERKLNKITPTKVYGLGMSGDNIIDNFSKYYFSQQLPEKVDIYFFGIIENDLILSEYGKPDRYSDYTFGIATQGCSGEIVPQDTTGDQYLEAVKATRTAEYHVCFLNNVAQLLPTENAYYIAFSDFKFLDPTTEFIKQTLADHGKQVISTKNLLTDVSNGNYDASSLDPHPGKRAHAAFADIMYQIVLANHTDEFTK